MGSKDGKTEEESRATVEDDFSKDRGQWSNSVEFLLTCVGYVVGLGNIYRFPFMVYTNGGGAFLIAYFILNFTFALGLVLMEGGPAQFSGRGPQSMWICVPILKGCGYASIIIMLLIAVPFCSIYMWSWYYMFASFTSVLPWSTCGNDYNSEFCYSSIEASPCEAKNGTFYKMTCYNSSDAAALNLTDLPRVPATMEFFIMKLYQVDPVNTISNIGGLKWDLVLTSLFSWCLTFMCVIKGISSIGKVVYFTATFPYLIIAIMIARGATLPGSMDGIDFYLRTDWSKLLEFKTWAFAATQILFSVVVGFGGLITFSSYNKFKNNIVRDSIIIVAVNGITSFYAAFAVFTAIGFMAKELGQKVEDVVQLDFLLVFVTYPEVVTRIYPAPLWSCLFFLMLVIVALDSVITGVEVLQTGMMDAFPRLRRYKTYVALGWCIFFFLLTLPECTMGGLFFVIILDWYVATFAIVIVVFFEVIALVFCYGPIRMCTDISMMVGNNLWWRVLQWYFLFLWIIVCPIVLLGVLIGSVMFFPAPDFGMGEVPYWANVVGWLSGFCALLAFPLGALHTIYKSYEDKEFSGTFIERFAMLFKPARKWGPRGDTLATLNEKTVEAAYDNAAFQTNNTQL